MKAVKSFLITQFAVLSLVLTAVSVFGQVTGGENKTASDPVKENKVASEEIKTDETDEEIPTPTPNLRNNNESYRIGYQDTIEVLVNRHPLLSGTFQINQDGTINLPRIDKPVVAVCKTERELANDIAAEFKKSLLKNPYVNVRAVEQKSQAFGVIGAVEKPGYYYVSRKIHLLELLAFAGGPSEKHGTRLIVARTGSSSICQGNQKDIADPEIELFNFKLLDIQQAKQNLWMKPGDIVSVLEAEVVYVVGNVNEPGEIVLRDQLTLSQAIATAKGIKPSTKKDKIRILRQKSGSQDRDELVFSLKDIEERKIQDPILQASDIVAVSEDQVKSIMRSVGKAFTGGIPSLFYRVP